MENVQSHIGSLNWGYRVQLRDKGVEYINAYAKFTDPHTVQVCAFRTPTVLRSLDVSLWVGAAILKGGCCYPYGWVLLSLWVGAAILIGGCCYTYGWLLLSLWVGAAILMGGCCYPYGWLEHNY